MAYSPFDLIRQTTQKIVDKGKSVLSSVDSSIQKDFPSFIKKSSPAPQEFAKDILQGTARGVATIGQTVLSPVESIINKGKLGLSSTVTPKTKFEQAIYGINTPFNVTSEGLYVTRAVGIKEGSRTEKVLAPVLGTLFPLLDAIPGGRPAKTAIERFAPEALQNFVKTTDPNIIRKSLIDAGVDSRIVQRAADDIARATDIRQVEKSLKGLPIKEIPISSSGIKSKPLDEVIKNTEAVKTGKVNLIDYVRTPERVFNKLGLGEEFQKLRIGHEQYLKDFQAEVNKINKWKKSLPRESSVRLFKYLDGQDIKLADNELAVAKEIRKTLDGWAKKLKIPQDKRVSDYITRIFDDGAQGVDEDLAFILKEKLPSGVFNPFELQRTGASGYKEDVWKALDAYVSKATRKLNLDEPIKAFEVAENLKGANWGYIKGRLDRINFRPTAIDEITDNTIKSVLDKFGKIGEKISNKLGERPTKKVLSPLRTMGYRGTLGLNIGSALKNLSQGINTISTIGEKYSAIGYKALFNKVNRQELIDEGVLNYGFIEDSLKDTAPEIFKKMDKALFSFFESAEKINRGAAYFGAKAKALAEGKSTKEAIEYAKEITRKTQFQFGELDTPAFLDSQIVKTVFQLQSFTVKQIEFLAEMALKDKNFAGLLRYAVYGWLFTSTIGELFGMEPKDLIPQFRIGGGLVFAPIIETGKAVLDMPDKFGNERDLKTKAEDIGKSLLPFVPAGVQTKKTFEGIKSLIEGGSFTDTGKQRFESPETPAGQARSILFGPNNTAEAQRYFDEGSNAKTVIKTEEQLKQEVKDKLASGEFGSNAVAAEYIKTELEKIRTQEKEKRATLSEPEFKAEIKRLISEGKINNEDATNEIKSYIKKQSEGKTTDRTEDYVAKRNNVELVIDYGKAFVIDRGNAWKALSSDEKLGIVEGNLVELQRFKGIKYDEKGGSEEYKAKAMQQLGIPLSKKADYKLEHIVPVKAGGDNAPNNLQVIPNEEHYSYTKWDILASKAVQKKRMTRKEVAKIAIKLKMDKSITLEEAISQLK